VRGKDQQTQCVSPSDSPAGAPQLRNDNKRSGLAALLLLPSGLVMAWLISKAQWFWTHRPDLQFGWIVLCLTVYLLWEAWEQKPPLRPKLTVSVGLLGVLGLAILFLIQIYQAAFGTTAAQLAGLAVGVMLIVAANLVYVFGWIGWRHFAFGFCFLLIALPMPTAIYQPVVSNLQSKVASLNVEILSLLGIPAQKTGSLIRLSNCTVGIDEACSGIRSLQSTVMATLFIGYLSLKARSLQLVLLVGGMLLAIFGNVVRSLFLSYKASVSGVNSIAAFHDAAGWSILAFTGAAVILLAWLLHKLERTSSSPKL
jgi:exosortase